MTDHYEMPHARADECPHAGFRKACRPCRDRFERAPITPDERAAMRALADAATTGPWEAHEGTVGAMTGPRDCGGCSGLVSPRHEPACFWSEVAGAAPADAAFIAAARTAVPRLLDALDTAEAEVARLRDTLARAWDEGAEAGRLNTYEHRPGREMRNPYREEDRRG